MPRVEYKPAIARMYDSESMCVDWLINKYFIVAADIA
jgi:hypothetical protein